jgi:5-methylthioadenosine/S-adenosylhomocysteine deaminase
VFLDLQHVNWVPCNDPTNQLVHTEDGHAVESVMVGGRMIVEQRRVTTVDMAALARDAEAARARLARLNARSRDLYERLAAVVGRFCPGLARTPYHVTRYVGA